MLLAAFAFITVLIMGIGGPLFLLWKDGLLKK